jgi:hypothetical protein
MWVVVGAMQCIGCGKEGLQTEPVSGTVTIDGRAYTQGGSVVFQPEGKGKQAAGKIEPDGSFKLSTYSPGDGAIVGKHKVLVMPLPPADIGDDQDPVQQRVSPLTQALANTPSNQLIFEVKSDAANRLDLDLKTR